MRGEFKEKFSEVLGTVKHGEEVTIKSDKKEENIAVLVPFEKYTKVTIWTGENLIRYLNATFGRRIVTNNQLPWQ